ncbi:MAG: hypothetical protein PUH03_06700 [bacterium]|nr:hypothetical protein [bacterium]MDY2830355.1 hypothetical protein [Alphaproteobacteria bacterium]
MKPLFVLLKIVIVGLLWSIFFIEGIRVIMLTNWHFDIFRLSHWQHAWNLWLSGWVIDEPKEWAFVLIILTAVPVWITVWAGLSSLNWSEILSFLSSLPLKILNNLFGTQVKKLANTASVKVVKKKKSYKEIRPKSLRSPVEDDAPRSPVLTEERRAALSGITLKPKPKPAPEPIAAPKAEPKEFTHSLFEMSDAEPIDFDLFEEPAEKPEPKQTKTSSSPQPKPASRQSSDKTPQKKQPVEQKQPQSKPRSGSVNSSFELLKQKGYEIITGATIKNTFIDFVGVSKTQLCLCLNDKEPGDWLADEERFNDEEPLWFSESSHRISPVRKIDIARTTLEEKLKEADLSFEVTPFVIEQIGNIINAEDMFDVWKELKINVTRIDRGTPKEIPLFAKTLEEADGTVDKAVFEKLKKLLRNIA